MAARPPSFTPAQITHLAQLLDEPTGSELRRDLKALRLPLGTESTKWRMLLSGLELLEDGRLVTRTASRTADDARSRADALRAKLSARQVHPDVLRYCRAELVQRNYFHAVLEAAKSVSAKIREATGLQSDGAQLVEEAFSLKDGMPPLAFNSLETPSQRSAHSGYAHFARGVVGAFRNPTAHDAKIEFELSEEDALDMLATISMVHRRLDKATITPSAPGYAARRTLPQ